ncbi:hypothetical protein FRC12_000158 [Ceratobasidium sp. 428]|nr:hypothetical protein FRC12_000158 [Ceratobasidium sp. 428]
MSEVSVPTQTHDSPCVDPATPSHKRVAGANILLADFCNRPIARYLLRRDEHKILVIGYDSTHVPQLLGVLCGEKDLVPPATWPKRVQITWKNNILQVVDLGPIYQTYFTDKYKFLEPRTAYTIAENLKLGLKSVCLITITFEYEDWAGAETTQTRLPCDPSQVISTVTPQPQPDPVPEHSPEVSNRVCIDLTATGDNEDDKADDVVFLRAVRVRDHPLSAPSGEGDRTAHQPLATQGKRKRIHRDQDTWPSTRTRVSVSVGTQTSPTPIPLTPTPPPTVGSQIGEFVRIGLAAAVTWGAMTYELR